MLVLSPHPDDDVIGCGGSIAKHVRAGARVTVVIPAGRERSMLAESYPGETFEAETDAANNMLGVHRCVKLTAPFGDLPPDRGFLTELVKIMREVRPQVVYLPHADDDDLEHQAVHQAGLTALRTAQSQFVHRHGLAMPAPKLVLGYEVWAPLSRFQYVEDIGAQLETKVAAMRCYQSQLNHRSWDEGVRGLAAYRGLITSGGGYAEVFQVLSPAGGRRD